MFLFLLLSPARLFGTRTKSESGSVVSGLDPGDCLEVAGGGGCLEAADGPDEVTGVSLVSILSLASWERPGLTSPWVTAGDGGNIGGSGPGADTGTATVLVCSWSCPTVCC